MHITLDYASYGIKAYRAKRRPTVTPVPLLKPTLPAAIAAALKLPTTAAFPKDLQPSDFAAISAYGRTAEQHHGRGPDPLGSALEPE